MNLVEMVFKLDATAVDETMANLEAILEATLGRVASWVAPVPEAIMTARAAELIFDVGKVPAIMTAVSMELVGLTVGSNWLKVRAYNAVRHVDEQDHTQDDPPVSQKTANALMVTYYGISVALIGGISVFETFQGAQQYQKLLAVLFPVVSVIGVASMNLRVQLYKAQDEASRNATNRKRTASRARRRQERQQAEEMARKEAESQRKQEESQLANLASLGTQEAVLAFFSANPHATHAQAGQAVGVSRQRVGQVLKELEQEGKVRNNGKVEVLT